MSARSARLVIRSRLLVLQSRRLILSSMERRLGTRCRVVTSERMNEAQQATERAHRRYRKAVLNYESPQSPDYWLVAYDELLETGGALRSRLRAATTGLPARERLEATADAEVLEQMIARWTVSIRETIAEGVAS